MSLEGCHVPDQGWPCAGHIVYFGEREGVMPFFNSVGFQLPARKGIADFLQEVTSRKDQQVRPSRVSVQALIGSGGRFRADVPGNSSWCTGTSV